MMSEIRLDTSKIRDYVLLATMVGSGVAFGVRFHDKVNYLEGLQEKNRTELLEQISRLDESMKHLEAGSNVALQAEVKELKESLKEKEEFLKAESERQHSWMRDFMKKTREDLERHIEQVRER